MDALEEEIYLQYSYKLGSMTEEEKQMFISVEKCKIRQQREEASKQELITITLLGLEHLMKTYVGITPLWCQESKDNCNICKKSLTQSFVFKLPCETIIHMNCFSPSLWEDHKINCKVCK